MKPAVFIAMTCTVAMVFARGDDQITPAAPTPDEPELTVPVPTESELSVESPEPQDRESLVEEEAPNEIIFDKLSLKGAAIQWFKTDNILQLFNPFAPARYGNGDQNLGYDIITGKPKGMTILAIEWGGARAR